MSRDRETEALQRINPDTTAYATVAGEIGPAEFEAYLAHLVHLDLPLPAKIELIRALQKIMQSFVDRAFGDDPAQLARESKGDAN
ncbi:hypothetical protein [Hyphomicrobium sp. CS1BSMeth3]|uniref:hypothetical protein n=1 Tax=Hyphomicrobium sp. CS1BSMeth3 TaxID=1892844 RepID=UPI00116022F2|nr:hypothetical protein [Hyphomicrobium sp. CS1BSMeth3]